ncbi:MerR family transcriptional regulator [Neolewinella antarctica]|uniref:DNA-binding transcriptional MerR regulator n=1 Tax=Neolewinella antarctica TaxID=442734 RepID=A0ABX0XBT6_9BACT|nr:MerR family transcriptional regulator [Neolewinella antarctica]NJC26741.1 DNA-binding transcriptional MerR regulator [Neolewinella antarctica]
MAKDISDDDLKLYYSIGEVAKKLGISATKIRYWDKEFSHLKPSKNSRGDRRFTKDNVKQLQQIDFLLNQRGFTLEGARKEIASGKRKSTDKSEIIDRLVTVKRKLEGLL